MSISKLYFGKDDAERDFTNSGLLKAGFLKTAMYNEAKQGRKSLIIGRKGAGKSAICLMLHNNFVCEHNTYSCLITPDAISAEEIRRFELLGVNEEQAKKMVWLYIFLVQIAKFILEIAKKEKIENEDIAKIKEFLIANKEINELTFQDKFWRIISRIKASITLSAFGQEVELQTNDTPNEGIKLESKLEFLEQYLLRQIANINHFNLYLLVDKVDEIWNNDSWSDLMVISLLMASKQINEKFAKAKCIVFLRKDIYDLLKFHDRDKFRGDEVHLQWTDDKLEQLILLRANASLNENMNINEFWERFFPHKVDNINTFNFLIERTLKRPRDIIQFCNLCRDNAQVNGNIVISEEDIFQATEVYSNWKLNDLIAEWKINYPYLNDLFILFSNSNYLVSRKRFQQLFSQIKANLELRYSDYIESFSEDSILNILYSIGFIGIERNGKTSYYYEDSQTVEFKDKMFVVHPAFRNSLKCISSINIKPFETNGDDERYYFETRRGRNASRTLIESSRSVYSGYEKTSYRIEHLLSVLENENLPTDISVELTKNFKKILKGFRGARYGDIVELEILRRSCVKYFDDVYSKLRESEYLTSKSELFYELESLRKDLFRSSSWDDRDYIN